MNNNEIRETLKEMLVNWNVCMEIAMRDAGKSEEEAVEMVGKMFTALVKPQ
jgi:hypothetical protein